MNKPKTTVPRLFLGSELVGSVAKQPSQIDLDDDDSERTPHTIDLGEMAALARLAGRGVLDFVAVDEALGGNPVFSGRRRGGLDALRLAARLAPATEGVHLVPLVRATWVEPSGLLESLIQLEVASGGRHGWELQLHDHASPREHSGELLTAVVADTWSDAEPRTRLAAQMRAQRGRKLNWKAGEAHDKLSPSRPTLVMRADTPEAASLAAERADVARVTAATREEADAKSRSLKDAASNNGRDPASLKVLTDLTVTLAKAPEHAEARKDLAEEMLGHRLGGAGARYVGTPPGLAETCAEWVAAGASDGFTLLPTSLPTDLILVAEEVTPVLARWGHTRGGYPPPARKMILSRKAATEGAPQRGGAPARISP